MTTPQYPGYPDDGSQSGMGAGGGLPPYPAGAMGGVPRSVGDVLSCALTMFKDDALLLVVGCGVWALI